jgi:chromosome partitioning protein
MNRNGTHVIVIGNEKGGSGKSTTAFHLAIYLLHQGFRVASIDVDSRQQTFTQYVRNRRDWARGHDLKLPHTTHYHLPLTRSDSIKENQKVEFDLFRQAVIEVEGQVDYLVVDTPGFDTHLTRLAHSLADTLITPLNDSVIDLDVMAHVDPVTGDPREMSHYARLVQRARTERLAIDGRTIDWVLVRNRISMLSSRSMRLVQSAIEKIAVRLTVFDTLDAELLGGLPPTSHLSARQEYKALAEALQLPVSERAAARQAALSIWQKTSGEPIRFEHMAGAGVSGATAPQQAGA